MANQQSCETKIVSGERLTANGCPYCGAKAGSPELWRKKSELPPKLQPCGNISRHTCGGCGKVCISISGIVLPDLRKTLGLPLQKAAS